VTGTKAISGQDIVSPPAGLPEETSRELRLKAEKIRKRILEIIYSAGAGHTGGSLSATDILVALYFHHMRIDPARPDWPNRDRFILSKGHCVESLYCVLSGAGFFDDRILDTYGRFNTILAGHPTRHVPGVELNSGSLGHGLSVGVGMALAARMDHRSYRVFVLMGDGEQGEGSIYEAAMAASHYGLDNLIAIIDRNRLQISGNTEDVMGLHPIDRRWESLGWTILEADGNDVASLIRCLESIPVNTGKPHLIIAHTLKGKGVSFMENQAKWHHGVPDREQMDLAIREIESRIAALQQLKPLP
jgi:transketolase